jgi:ParB-like chromosome segregation protein Spo0J
MDFDECVEFIVQEISELNTAEKVKAINKVRERIHAISPFKDEPVDFVKWVPADFVEANDYNPNSVAAPEMQLLELSIMEDGYTQPIVAWEKSDRFEVVDGFHRHRVGRECESVAARIKGFLPLAVIRDDREDRGDRIASTIRHNRARGKHAVQSMSDIVIELKRRNWSDKKVGKELGMDPDEVLRLSQISGLAEMFSDQEFSEAWESDEVLGGPESELIDDKMD